MNIHAFAGFVPGFILQDVGGESPPSPAADQRMGGMREAGAVPAPDGPRHFLREDLLHDLAQGWCECEDV